MMSAYFVKQTARHRIKTLHEVKAQIHMACRPALNEPIKARSALPDALWRPLPCDCALEVYRRYDWCAP